MIHDRPGLDLPLVRERRLDGGMELGTEMIPQIINWGVPTSRFLPYGIALHRDVDRRLPHREIGLAYLRGASGIDAPLVERTAR